MARLRKNYEIDGVVQIASVAPFNDEGKLLFGRRRDDGKWTLPGGHMEPGETPQQGAVRELVEETGLTPTQMDSLGSGPVIDRKGRKLMIHCFRAFVDGKPSNAADPDQEVSEWRWVDVDDGLPDEILANLSARKNVTLQFLGLQDEETGTALGKADYRLGHDQELDHYKPHKPSISKDLIDKIHVSKIGDMQGFAVWRVDGELVRNVVHIDFTQGGNPARYKYVPEGEVWVDDVLDDSDAYFTIVHELFETKLMQEKGLSYNVAHDKASQVEAQLREKTGKGSELVKMQTGPTFPLLGLGDDRRETPIVSTPRELSNKANLLHAANLQDIVTAQKKKGVTYTPQEIQEARTNLAAKDATGGTTVGLTYSGPRAGKKVTVSYAAAVPLRAPNEQTGPKSDLATKAHEDFHQMMNRVQAKYGVVARKKLGKWLVESMNVPSKTGKMVNFPKMYVSTGLDLEGAAFPDEEVVGHLINYLNDPAARAFFHHHALEDDPETGKLFQTGMKRAHRKMLHAASGVVPEYFKMFKAEVDGFTPSLKKLVSKVREVLTDDLRRPKYRGAEHPMTGHCYVASEALYHLLGGSQKGWKPMNVQHEGDSHWFLQHSSGRILDPTGDQFKTPVPYDQGKGKGFLTKEPSARAQQVMERMMGDGLSKAETYRIPPEQVPQFLYHTPACLKDVPSIKKRGLIPGAGSNSWGWTERRGVYFTKASKGGYSHSDDRHATLRVDTSKLDKSRFVADEDDIEWGAKKGEEPNLVYMGNVPKEAIEINPNRKKPEICQCNVCQSGLSKAEDEIERLMQHPDPAERRMALKLGGVNSSHLARALTHPDINVARSALYHPRLDAHALLALMAGPHNERLQHEALGSHLVDSRHLVALHNTVKEFPSSTRRDLLEAIGRHPALDSHTIDSLYHDPEGQVPKVTLLTHPNAPGELINKVLFDHLEQPGDPGLAKLAQRAAHHPQADPKLLHRALIEGKLPLRLAASVNPVVGPDTIETVLRAGTVPKMDDPDTQVRVNLLGGSNVHDRHLDIALENHAPEVKNAVFKVKNALRPRHVARALQGNDLQHALVALGSPVADSEHARGLLDHPDTQMRILGHLRGLGRDAKKFEEDLGGFLGKVEAGPTPTEVFSGIGQDPGFNQWMKDNGDHGNGYTPHDLTHGLCHMAAIYAKNRLGPSAKIWAASAAKGMCGQSGHFFVEHGGKFYDAGTPQGVDKPSQLSLWNWPKQAQWWAENHKDTGTPQPTPEAVDASVVPAVEAGENSYTFNRPGSVPMHVGGYKPIRKSEEPLMKMAVQPKDMAQIVQGLEPEGAKLVDHTPDLQAHPASHGPSVELYRHHVIDTPQPVKAAAKKVLGSSNYTRKVIYKIGGVDPGRKPSLAAGSPWSKLPDTQETADAFGEAMRLYNERLGSGEKFMVKPYHEKIGDHTMRKWAKHPHQGWAEMTNQALYHAGGIGHLHQHVFTVEHNMGPGHEKEPALVVHLAKGFKPAQYWHDDLQHEMGDEAKGDIRKIALMDFMTGNLDRHAGNLMYNPDTHKAMAIDHSRSFQYTNIWPSKRKNAKELAHERDVQDNLGHYIKDTAIGLADPLPRHQSGYAGTRRMSRQELDQRIDKHREGWQKALDWWGENSGAITKALDGRLSQIKDPRVRDHIKRNWEARRNLLDQMADFGLDNFGREEWHEASVPLYKPGQLTDEEQRHADAMARWDAKEGDRSGWSNEDWLRNGYAWEDLGDRKGFRCRKCGFETRDWDEKGEHDDDHSMGKVK